MTIDFNEFVKLIPELLDIDEILSTDFFDKIHNYVGINNYNIYLLNSDTLNLIYPSETEIEISAKLSEKLFKGKELEKQELKTLYKTKNELFLDYLKIKGSIFGIIIYEKENFTEENITILNIITKLLSNKLKEKELQKIIQNQLKTLTKAVEEVKSAEKIKTDFIANVSHELRTPLNAILGFSELLSNNLVGNLNEKQTEYTEDIKVSAIHLLGIVNEILDMSKIESNSVKIFKQKFNLKQAIEEVINILYPLIKRKNLTIIKDYEPELMINADYQKIQQILFNLLSNAIKFTDEGGTITVHTELTVSNVIFSITDTGIGIKKSDYKKIFKKFTQLNDANVKKEASTGLGLTITMEYVKLHNGTIVISSEINEGTTFTIRIPY